MVRSGGVSEGEFTVLGKEKNEKMIKQREPFS